MPLDDLETPDIGITYQRRSIRLENVELKQLPAGIYAQRHRNRRAVRIHKRALRDLLAIAVTVAEFDATHPAIGHIPHRRARQIIENLALAWRIFQKLLDDRALVVAKLTRGSEVIVVEV